MLCALMRQCRNYFRVSDNNPIREYTVENGEIVGADGIPSLFPGMLFLVAECQSCPPLNGLYQFDGTGTIFGANGTSYTTVKNRLPIDGNFRFSVIPVAPPDDFIELAIEMEAWKAAHPDGEIVSENLSATGYSYSKATSKNGGALDVWGKFGDRIAMYRRVCSC